MFGIDVVKLKHSQNALFDIILQQKWHITLVNAKVVLYESNYSYLMHPAHPLQWDV